MVMERRLKEEEEECQKAGQRRGALESGQAKVLKEAES